MLRRNIGSLPWTALLSLWVLICGMMLGSCEVETTDEPLTSSSAQERLAVEETGEVFAGHDEAEPHGGNEQECAYNYHTGCEWVLNRDYLGNPIPGDWICNPTGGKIVFCGHALPCGKKHRAKYCDGKSKDTCKLVVKTTHCSTGYGSSGD